MRLSLDVGQRQPLPDIAGQCIGDDMTWKGSKTLRIASVQCGSTGRDRFQWGLWHGQGLRALGADIGILSETALHGDAQHAQACRGLHSCGYHAVSHGRPRNGPADYSAAGSGVILAVRAGYSGSWTDVAKDPSGRAICAVLHTSSGIDVRCLALYGPVGACLPQFGVGNPRHSEEEQALKGGEVQQLLVVGGDLNSFVDVELDSWGGHYIVRQSMASHLVEHGLQDTFRSRHPRLRAFTFYSQAGSASRLDSIWWLPCPQVEVQLLNAAILWQWDRRVDHDPVLVDLALHLPEASNSPSVSTPWRSLVRRLDGDLPVSIATRAEEHSHHIAQLATELDSLESQWHTFQHPPSEGLDGFLGVPTLPVPACFQARLVDVVDGVMSVLLSCIPPVSPTVDRRDCRTSAAWHACLLELKRVRQSIRDAVQCIGQDLVLSRFSLDEGHRLWQKASDMEAHLQTLGTLRPVSHLPDWDDFSSDRLVWATRLGFSRTAAAQPLPMATFSRGQEARAVQAPSAPSWSSLPPNAPPAAVVQLLDSCIAHAASRQSAATRRSIRSSRQQRIALLRRGDSKGWASRMKPPSLPQARYSPEWVTAGDGTRHRPDSAADVLVGATQEWAKLLQQPPQTWNHASVMPFLDTFSRSRGAVDFVNIGDAPIGHDTQRVGQSFLSPGPWRLVHFQAADVRFVTGLDCVRVGEWVLCLLPDGWYASRPQPCPGRFFRVMSLRDIPAASLTPDHFRGPPPSSFLVLRIAEPPTYDLVGRASPAEIAALTSRFRHSRPGPSGWKLCFIEAFPCAFQTAFWHAVDLQRLTGAVSATFLRADQLHLSKPSGGWRPLSMIEEHVKAIEAPVVERLALSRAGWSPDAPFSVLNRAYTKGVAAAAEVLYLDSLVCEDARRHNRPLLRIPADYEKFFNTLNLPQIDAVQQGRGIPHAVRRLHCSLFSKLRVTLDTRSGPSQPLAVTRGVPQGAVSSPELSRTAQDPLLRLRACDGAAYTTSAGRSVPAAGYVDDIEHYGDGLRDLPAILHSLALGSSATGVGFAWSKFSAFATDWDETLPHLQHPGLNAEGASVSSWNIWAGGVQRYNLPRSQADQVDVLLGKRGTPMDRHSLASQDLVEKLAAARQRIACKCCSWDEGLAMIQMILGGVLSYAPLIGIPPPVALHQEDAALHRLLLSSLGTRTTAEHVSLSASRKVGGLGVPLLTDLLVAAVAADIIVLLNGTAPASLVARDTLRQALLCSAADLPKHAGTLTDAMRFLAGYGFYLSLSTDRFVARVLDNLNTVAPQLLVGGFVPAKFDAAARFCRFGVLANSIRSAWTDILFQHGPHAAWHDPVLWAHALPQHAPISPAECARAASRAYAQSQQDWTTECSLFHASPLEYIAEDWLEEAWEDPWNWRCDPRSRLLLSTLPTPGDSDDQALYGDGGYSQLSGATYACQARSFGQLGEYWDSSAWVSQQLAGKLPHRLGWESTSIHTAELLSLVCALRFRRPDQWHLLVFDRSALFSSMRVAVAGSVSRLVSSQCSPLVVMLKHVFGELRRAWSGFVPAPSWKLHQQRFPHQWNIQLPVDGHQRTFSRIAFAEDGVVGVDIRSHQTNTSLPFPVLTQGNEAQDAGCSAQSRSAAPPDIRVPTAGTFAWIGLDGRMVTGPIRQCVRQVQRGQSEAAWSERPVQGLLPRVANQIFTPSLDPSLHTQCTFPSTWLRWTLTADTLPIDLSAVSFRLHWAIGGAWTERLHVNPSLQTHGLSRPDGPLPAHAHCAHLRLALRGTPLWGALPCPPSSIASEMTLKLSSQRV